MSNMLEEMRKRVKERQPTFEVDNSIFPFWNLKFGNSATIRFLPYNDQFTGAFWAERVLLPMSFTDPADNSKVLKFMGPCREMYDRSEKCPLLAPVRNLYAEEKELRNTGKTQDADKIKKIAGYHWKKPTYYYQGFVVKSGLPEDELPENPIRVLPINKKIHQKIFNSIFENNEDPFEMLPTGEFTVEDIATLLDGGEIDLERFNGRNFIIKKMQQGDYADWTTGSQWQTKESPLDEEQLTAIAKYGLHDLTKRLPDRPSDEQYEVLVEMMETSINRMVNGENGLWKKEWEEAGFKPIRPRSAKSSDSDGSDNSEDDNTSTARKTTAAANAEKASGTSDALARLRASRGKAKDADDETTVEESASESEPETDSGNAATANVQALADKIRSRVSKSA